MYILVCFFYCTIKPVFPGILWLFSLSLHTISSTQSILIMFVDKNILLDMFIERTQSLATVHSANNCEKGVIGFTKLEPLILSKKKSLTQCEAGLQKLNSNSYHSPSTSSLHTVITSISWTLASKKGSVYFLFKLLSIYRSWCQITSVFSDFNFLWNLATQLVLLPVYVLCTVKYDTLRKHIPLSFSSYKKENWEKNTLFAFKWKDISFSRWMLVLQEILEIACWNF